MGTIAQAVLTGTAILLAGTIPRNLLFAANLRYFTSVPWAVPLTAAYIWLFWRYLGGAGPPASTAAQRRISLRANALPGRVWAWALLAGGLAVVALVMGLQVANRMLVLPQQAVPPLAHVPAITIGSLLLLSAPVAGIIEESAFRGYMQAPLERRCGLPVAILITGTMFALVHLDFTPILWPYYVTVAAIYGIVTYLTDSILPAIVLHTSGNLYSNFDLWLRGQAEWQAAPGPASLIWTTGVDAAFWTSLAALVLVSAASIAAFVALRRITRVSAAQPIPVEAV